MAGRSPRPSRRLRSISSAPMLNLSMTQHCRSMKRQIHANFHREAAKIAKVCLAGFGATWMPAPPPNQKNLRALRGFAVEMKPLLRSPCGAMPGFENPLAGHDTLRNTLRVEHHRLRHPGLRQALHRRAQIVVLEQRLAG